MRSVVDTESKLAALAAVVVTAPGTTAATAYLVMWRVASEAARGSGSSAEAMVRGHIAAAADLADVREARQAEASAPVLEAVPGG